MTLTVIRLLLHWRFCLTLISEFNLAFFVLPEGGKKGVNHINLRFMTPVTGDLPHFRIIVASVSGGLTLNSSTLQHNSETFASYGGSTMVHLGCKIIY